jgi:hypothetical protein
VQVDAKVNKHSFKANLVPLGKGKFRLYLHGIIRKKANVGVGDVVKIRLKEDLKPRAEKMHELLAEELKQDQLMKNNWKKLRPSRKKEILRYLNNLKTEESLKRNVAKVVRMLTKDPKERLGGISITTRTVLLLFLGTTLSLLVFSCKKKRTNQDIYNEANSSDLVFYKNKDTIYAPAGTSPHGPFKLKFNQTAANALGADGKLPLGQTFPDGSLIVKEVYTNGIKSLYAVMKKDHRSKFASNKWVWAEYELNGDVKVNVSREGADCVSCHSGGNPRDLTLSFDLH